MSSFVHLYYYIDVLMEEGRYFSQTSHHRCSIDVSCKGGENKCILNFKINALIFSITSVPKYIKRIVAEFAFQCHRVLRHWASNR